MPWSLDVQFCFQPRVALEESSESAQVFQELHDIEISVSSCEFDVSFLNFSLTLLHKFNLSFYDFFPSLLFKSLTLLFIFHTELCGFFVVVFFVFMDSVGGEY